MTRTKIHTTKKLEKLVRKLISTDQNSDYGKLGKWNATVFYVNRKKCWLLTNGFTKYNLILTDIKATDLKNIGSIFKESFYGQLVYDGIPVDFKKLEATIGQLEFLPTDNDRSITGFQNQRLYELDYWIHDYETLENMPIKVLTNRMNKSALHPGKSRQMSDYTNSIREMKKLLSE